VPGKTLLDALKPRIDALIDASTDAVFAIPGYRLRDDAALRADVRDHVERHLRAVLHAHEEGRTPARDDVAVIRGFAQRRVGRVSISEFVHAFEVGQQPLWEAVLSFADDEGLRPEMVALLMRIRQYFTLATVEAAEVYLEGEHARGATGEAIRRDLLHELLSGHPPTPGPRLDAARAAGLDAGSKCIVISAVPAGAAGDDELALRTGAATLARAASSALRPLVVVRVEEIVVVMRAPGDVATLAAKLEQAQQQLARQKVPLALAASTVYEGLAAVGDAYREAVRAREQILPEPGAIVLPSMSAFEYLTWRTDVTARHLIAPAVTQFLEQDARAGNVLLDTLRAYYAADLNAKLAAENLHLHVNTVYYRLSRIAEGANCNVRAVSDVVELLIAAGLEDRAATHAIRR
jgi:hypothetical protein